ncbi:MAG: DUF2085 domain-containing protein [Myxococcaceae bacterium]|nr:DUF2085 domain-containing protein [Myxococcaceae bacterium]
MFWLSHHFADEHHRCYRLGGWLVCARCAGVYPALALVFGLQALARAPLDLPLDVPVGLALSVPATLDWAVGRWRPHLFSNAWRSFTGLLLGAALGRSLYVHVQRPLPAVLLAQTVLVTAVAVPVILATWRHRRRG